MAQTERIDGLKIVFNFWRRHPWLAVGIFLFTVVSGAITVTYPYFLRLIIDGIKAEISREKLVRYAFLLAGVGGLRVVVDVIMPFIRGMTNERFQWETRSGVFGRLLDASHSFTNHFPAGDVMERLDHDLHELSWFACSGIFRFVNAAILAVLSLVMLFRMSVVLTLLVILVIGLGAFAWWRTGPVIYKWFMKWRERIAEVNNQLQSAFGGIRLVKAFLMDNRLARSFRATLDERVAVAVQEMRIESRVQVVYMMLGEFATLLVLWVGGGLVIGSRMSIGEFVAFNAYLLMLLPMMFDLGNLFVAGRRAAGAGFRVRELVTAEPIGRVVSGDKKPGFGELRLERVSAGYDTKPVVRNVNMVFPMGKRIGIAGTVGSGKSTLLRVMLGLLEPGEGRVVLNQTDRREFDIAVYRQLFGYVPQEPTLFSDTLKGNIIMGRPEDEARLRWVLKLVQLDKDVKELPAGWDEVLGDRGAGLSGGQKARLAIARALYGMPYFVLLDDATAGLDSDTERLFFEQLFKELPDRTIIVVSHRLKVLQASDYIYVLDRGEVQEEGEPDELLAKSGLYYRLYQRQILSEELEQI